MIRALIVPADRSVSEKDLSDDETKRFVWKNMVLP